MAMVIFFMDQNLKNNPLSKILDIKKLMNVDKPIESANGLPNECYTSEQYLEYERDKIFCDKWTVIGVGSSIPNAGDAKPYNLLGIPLIIVRDRDLNIRVFHNVCSHRGFKLIDKPCTLKNVIRCPYHSWSYDFKGNLVATPHIGGLNIHNSDKFKKNQSNLKEVRSKVWMDIIFVNINSNEIDFEDYIKPLEDRWSKFINHDDQKLLIHSNDYGYFDLEVKSNWKFAIENYCESYHLPTIHPELNKVSDINDHYHIQGLPNRFAGQGSEKYEQPIKGNKKFEEILLPKIMAMVIFFMDQNLKNNPLSKILDIKKLMNVDKPIESANGLPNECYTSEQYLEYERDKIFCDKWTVIGVASSIPKCWRCQTIQSTRDSFNHSQRQRS